MIGGGTFVDANVLVPYLSGHDPELSARAEAVLDTNEQRFLPLAAVLETAFVLRTVYHYERRHIARSLVELITRANVETVELPKPAVITALSEWRDGAIGSAGDALIVACLRTHGARRFVTFDRRFPRDLGWEVTDATPA